MTDTQQEALNKASQILGEHFDHHCVIVGWEVLEENSRFYETAGSWDGGIPTAIGLCDIYHEKLTRQHIGNGEDE